MQMHGLTENLQFLREKKKKEMYSWTKVTVTVNVCTIIMIILPKILTILQIFDRSCSCFEIDIYYMTYAFKSCITHVIMHVCGV